MENVKTELNEHDLLNQFNKMCEESLDPETFQKWEDVKQVLRDTRRAFKNLPNELKGVSNNEQVKKVCVHWDKCINSGKNEYCDMQTFNELDCFKQTD